MVEYKVISEADWTAVAPVQRAAQVEQLLDHVQGGQIVRVAYQDRREWRSLVRQIPLRAARRGLHLERRDGEGWIAYRRAAPRD